MPPSAAHWTETDVPTGSTACPGAAGPGWRSRRSASSGCSTASRSGWQGPSRVCCKDEASLGLADAEVGLTAAVYLAGAALGALLFGYLTDWLGRKKLFTVTITKPLSAG